MTTIAVTGATGGLGGRIARLLAGDAADLVLVVRDPGRAPRLPRTQVRAADYADRDAGREALAGVDTLLMVSAAEAADRVDQHRTFIDAAADAGVGQVLYTSIVNASPTATFTLARDHAATEAHLRASGLPWTFLRDNLYADYLPLFVGDDAAIRGPAGDGRVAAVAQDDVAAVATVVLCDVAAHANTCYELTGPEALTLAEAAETITRLTGRETRFMDETLEEAYASRASYGAPAWQVDAWVSTYTAIATGELSAVTDHVEGLLGRKPLSLADLLSRP